MSTGIVTRQKKNALEKYVEFFLIYGRERNVYGNRTEPSAPINEVTLPVCCESNSVYVKHGKFENTENCMETA